jgi:integrase
VLKACAIRQRVIQSIGLGLFNYADEFSGSQQAKLARNAEQPRKFPTVGEVLDSWLVTVKNNIGENAFIDYSKDIKGQLKKIPLYALDSGSTQGSKRSLGTLGEMPVDQLTAGGINNLRNWFLARPVSVKRLMNLLIPLRGALSQLAQDEIIESDPFERVRPLKRKKKRVEPLPLVAVAGAAPLLSIEQVARFKEDDDRPDPFSPDEVAAFLAHMTEPFVYLVKLWLWTGLRTGELIALQWRDIDWERGEICVRNSLSRGIYKETKSDRVRWVKLLDPAREPLQAQFAHSGQAGTYVFLNPYTQKRWANESKFALDSRKR